jgi:uncharacterized protein
MKIDVFTHVMLDRYRELLYRYGERFATEKAVQAKRGTLWDLPQRHSIMDDYPDVVQVLSTTMPPVEEIVDAKEAVKLCQICNDEMAEVVAKYPERYIGAIANLPLNDMEASLAEAERTIKQLGFKGIQVYTSVNGKPPSSEELMPLYGLMAHLDLPIWVHPNRHSYDPDYPTEKVSHNQIFSIFGWLYETTCAMTRLVFAGIFERFPTLKIITHHCGAMVPFLADRIITHYENGLERLGTEFFPGLKKPPIEYYKMFYADTALDGSPSGLKCGLDFFGEDHLVFATDYPYDIGRGRFSQKRTIEAIEALNLPEATLRKIYEGNARRLMRL